MNTQKRTSQFAWEWKTHNEDVFQTRIKRAGNQVSVFAQKNRKEVKETVLHKNGRRLSIDPMLTTHIIKRNIDGIKEALDRTSRFHKPGPGLTTLSRDQLRAVIDIYGIEVVGCPLQLAIRMCANKTLEMTKTNGPTSYDVIHVLAENFDKLIEHAEHKGLPAPDLKVLMKFAGKLLRDAKNSDLKVDESNVNTAVLTLINGLSDKNKALVAEIFTPQETMTPAAA